MPNNYDIVTIGAGHNGLVAAAYLAVAGKKVLVLERNPWSGGGVVSGELTGPGYVHDWYSTAHGFIQGNPLLKNDELKLLSRYGLKYVYPEQPYACVFEDGTTIGLYRDRNKTYQDIAAHSKKDAEEFLRFAELGMRLLPLLCASLFSPPAPLGASLALLDQSTEGRELFAIMLKSPYDIAMETFENDKVRMFFARMASENMIGPEEKGTGLRIFAYLGFMERFGIGLPIGGCGELITALIRCIEDHGGTVLNKISVESVVVKNGRAVGVRTDDGTEYAAKDAVIGAIHPHLLGRMVPGVEPRVARDAARTEITTTSVISISAALNEPLRFKAGPHVNQACFIELMSSDMNEFRHFFDELRYRRVPETSLLGLASPSAFDPTRCPPGKATLRIWDYTPYDRQDGGAAVWDKLKEAHAQRMLKQMQPFIDNLTPENIIAYVTMSPLDIERASASFLRGDIHGIAPYMYQSEAHRPTPDLGQNIVPGVDRLYLVGPFQSPSGGVFGAGRATAIKMCEDLKIDFERIAQA